MLNSLVGLWLFMVCNPRKDYLEVKIFCSRVNRGLVMKAVWDAGVGLGIMSWAIASYILTLTMHLILSLVPLGRYLAGWPIGLAILLSICLFIVSRFAKRDHKVSISIVPEGLVFREDAVGYQREDLIPYEDIRSVRLRCNPFFKSLIVDLKEKNQIFSLSNVTLSDEFMKQVRARIEE